MGNNLSLLMIFAAGAASFISPCTLAIMPGYVGYFAASKRQSSIVLKALGFIIGFSIVFIIMGAAATMIGKLLVNNQEVLRKISGVVITIFGLHMLGIFKIKLFLKQGHLLNIQQEKYWVSSIILGIAFGLGWTPCVGQILAPILAYAGSTMNAKLGMFYLFIYSVGFSIPLVIFALLYEKYIYKISMISKYTRYIEQAAGVIFIITGILMYTNYLSKINGILSIY